MSDALPAAAVDAAVSVRFEDGTYYLTDAAARAVLVAASKPVRCPDWSHDKHADSAFICALCGGSGVLHVLRNEP